MGFRADFSRASSGGLPAAVLIAAALLATRAEAQLQGLLPGPPDPATEPDTPTATVERDDGPLQKYFPNLPGGTSEDERRKKQEDDQLGTLGSGGGLRGGGGGGLRGGGGGGGGSSAHATPSSTPATAVA